ncbi:hypothetical protein Efla_002290 [Eimeria flavescens]
MDLLIALKAGSSRQFRRRWWQPPACSPQPPLPPCQPRRLALSGSPEPYFAVNPHLFEDKELWSAERLRRLCSELGLAVSGSRTQLVARLQQFDRSSGIDSDAGYLERARGGDQSEQSGNLALVPIPCRSIPQQFKSGLSASSCGRPVLRRTRRRLALKLCRGEKSSSRLSERLPAAEEDACSSGSSTAAGPCEQPAEGHYPSKARRQKRQREERHAEGGHPTDSLRKEIRFSPFNSVQLIPLSGPLALKAALPLWLQDLLNKLF